MSCKRKQSAGLLMYRLGDQGLEIFLVHPGGPYFTHQDDGFWGIPKGLIEDGEELLGVAEREFAEETGRTLDECKTTDAIEALGTVVQRGGKRVHAWAFEGDWPDTLEICSNTFELEWPRNSGRFVETPEVDKGHFFPLAEARVKINDAQETFLDRLLVILRS